MDEVRLQVAVGLFGAARVSRAIGEYCFARALECEIEQVGLLRRELRVIVRGPRVLMRGVLVELGTLLGG